MGTNYYLVDWHGSRTHLAKTSGGWVPGIHDHEQYDGYQEFKEFVTKHGTIIKNEYGEIVDPEDLFSKLERFRDEGERRHQQEYVSYRDEGFDFIPGNWS